MGINPVHAAETRVAVAANFTAAAKEIGAAFERETGHKVLFSFGSTGQLYTQITQEAPFDVFLAADAARPQKAVDAGLADSASLFTYATGKIALFSMKPDQTLTANSLTNPDIHKIAIGNPLTAPYGAAAVETMKALGIFDKVESKIVQGTNIAQTYQFVHTENADIGFVALSQIAGHRNGSRWIVPENLYSVIVQNAVLLKRGKNNEAAKAFLSFLKGPSALAVKEKYGYGSASN
ncbi:molybdate ABC transporter substrate-binding protein [Kordiimonas pumila]|uniref:Molybdate ABC transporter substrate-binding protein n=1 Tax=Kordiimonas pumila TaxID=2161677 RepID=A0ABV7D084_9PROT|nr:molybdate ABC transporter substrate-binding protein [Kordiimonas pumila]